MNEELNPGYADQHAVITGGASGIGEAIAERLAKTGMRITLMGRNSERLLATSARLQTASQQVDVTCAEDIERGFAAAVKANGPATILVNNAGAAETSTFIKMDNDLWDRMLAVNLTGTYLCTKAVLAEMSKAGYGRIINIASTASQKGYAYVSAYCAAKHGVLGLTRAVALEMALKGVTVNCVCPGFTETDMVTRSLDTIMETTGMERQQALVELVKNNPQGRLIQPREIAEAVSWLCHPDSGSVTGQAIAVAGGEI